MKRSKTISITHESREFYVLHHTRCQLAYCVLCGRENEILTLDQAVTISKLSVLEIVKGIELGVIPHLETADGHLLFCSECLAGSVPGTFDRSTLED